MKQAARDVTGGGSRRARAVTGWLGLVAPALALALQACGQTPDADGPAATPSAGPDGDPVVLLDFEGGPAGTDASRFPDRGRLRGAAVVAAVNGGRVRVEARTDGGLAARLPAYDMSRRPARAVLVLQPATGDTRLDPADSDFEFGADFMLDSPSEGPGEDNGNNLVQRGLVADPTQYKLQVEHGEVSCRVAGSQGDVLVSSEEEVVADRWYTVTCARVADEVTLTLRPDAGGPVERVSSRGATGSLTYPVRTPLVVGGKVSPAGQVVSRNSDQFNGAVDNVFVTMD